MLEKGKISSAQAIMLLTCMISSSAILTVPTLIVRVAGQDAWMAVLAAVPVGLLISLLIVNLSLRFPGKTLLQYTEEILGKVPGKFVSFLLILGFLHFNSMIMNEYGSFLCIALMPETPSIVFHIAAIAVVVYASRNGIEVLCRFTQLVAPVILSLFLIVIVLSIKDIHLDNLLPVYEKGMASIFRAAIVPASWFGEVFVFSMIIPYLKNPKESYKVAVLTILISSLIFLISILFVICVSGSKLPGSWFFPVFNSFREIEVAEFIERLDAVIVMIWVLSGLIKVSVFYYAVLGSAQWLGLSDYRPLALPLGVIQVALAPILCDNAISLFAFLGKFLPPFISFFEVGIPLLLLTIALIRGKGSKGVV